MDRLTRQVRDEARFNQVLLLRLAGAGEDQAVVFSAICTHAGCVVSDWRPSTGRMHCPCHGSEYDLAHAAAVVQGPASLPLPMLPVRVVGDVIMVSGPFSAAIGGHTARTD